MKNKLPVFNAHGLIIPNAVAFGSPEDWSHQTFDFHKKEVKASGIDYRNYTIRLAGQFGPTCGYATGLQNAQTLFEAICEIEPEDYFRVVRMMGYQRYNIAAVKRMPHVIEVIKGTTSSSDYYGYCKICRASQSIQNGIIDKVSICPFTTDCLGFSIHEMPYGLIPKFLDYKDCMWVRNTKKMKWDDLSYPLGSDSEKQQRTKLQKLRNADKKRKVK